LGLAWDKKERICKYKLSLNGAVNWYLKKKKIMFIGSKARQVQRADDLTAICEPNV
jgi:hypothetical protein